MGIGSPLIWGVFCINLLSSLVCEWHLATISASKLSGAASCVSGVLQGVRYCPGASEVDPELGIGCCSGDVGKAKYQLLQVVREGCQTEPSLFLWKSRSDHGAPRGRVECLYGQLHIIDQRRRNGKPTSFKSSQHLRSATMTRSMSRQDSLNDARALHALPNNLYAHEVVHVHKLPHGSSNKHTLINRHGPRTVRLHGLGEEKGRLEDEEVFIEGEFPGREDDFEDRNIDAASVLVDEEYINDLERSEDNIGLEDGTRIKGRSRKNGLDAGGNAEHLRCEENYFEMIHPLYMPSWLLKAPKKLIYSFDSPLVPPPLPGYEGKLSFSTDDIPPSYFTPDINLRDIFTTVGSILGMAAPTLRMNVAAERKLSPFLLPDDWYTRALIGTRLLNLAVFEYLRLTFKRTVANEVVHRIRTLLFSRKVLRKLRFIHEPFVHLWESLNSIYPPHFEITSPPIGEDYFRQKYPRQLHIQGEGENQTKGEEGEEKIQKVKRKFKIFEQGYSRNTGLITPEYKHYLGKYWSSRVIAYVGIFPNERVNVVANCLRAAGYESPHEIMEEIHDGPRPLKSRSGEHFIRRYFELSRQKVENQEKTNSGINWKKVAHEEDLAKAMRAYVLESNMVEFLSGNRDRYISESVNENLAHRKEAVGGEGREISASASSNAEWGRRKEDIIVHGLSVGEALKKISNIPRSNPFLSNEWCKIVLNDEMDQGKPLRPGSRPLPERKLKLRVKKKDPVPNLEGFVDQQRTPFQKFVHDGVIPAIKQEKLLKEDKKPNLQSQTVFAQHLWWMRRGVLFASLIAQLSRQCKETSSDKDANGPPISESMGALTAAGLSGVAGALFHQPEPKVAVRKRPAPTRRELKEIKKRQRSEESVTSSGGIALVGNIDDSVKQQIYELLFGEEVFKNPDFTKWIVQNVTSHDNWGCDPRDAKHFSEDPGFKPAMEYFGNAGAKKLLSHRRKILDDYARSEPSKTPQFLQAVRVAAGFERPENLIASVLRLCHQERSPKVSPQGRVTLHLKDFAKTGYGDPLEVILERAS